MNYNISGYSVSIIPLIYSITDTTPLGCQSNGYYITTSIRKYCGICCAERNTLTKWQSQFLVEQSTLRQESEFACHGHILHLEAHCYKTTALKTVEFILNSHVLIKPIHLAASRTNVNTEHRAQKKEQSK